MANPARYDSGVHFQRVRQINHGHRRGSVMDDAGFPDRMGDQSLFSPFVRLDFFRVIPSGADVAQCQVIYKGDAAAPLHMAAYMRQFVQQTEPTMDGGELRT